MAHDEERNLRAGHEIDHEQSTLFIQVVRWLIENHKLRFLSHRFGQPKPRCFSPAQIAHAVTSRTMIHDWLKKPFDRPPDSFGNASPEKSIDLGLKIDLQFFSLAKMPDSIGPLERPSGRRDFARENSNECGFPYSIWTHEGRLT